MEQANKKPVFYAAYRIFSSVSDSAQAQAQQAIAALDENRAALLSKIKNEPNLRQSTQATLLFFDLFRLQYPTLPFPPKINWEGKPTMPEVPLFFNLTHTSHLVAVVVGDHPCGIDAEDTGGDEKLHFHISKRFFSPADDARFSSGTSFPAIWCENESYLKYTGLGLALPMRTITKERNHVSSPGKMPGVLYPRKIGNYSLCVCLPMGSELHWTRFPSLPPKT